MAKQIDFKFSSAGYREIMKSPAVQAVLRAKAQAVRSRVASQYTERDWDVIADVQVGKTRARAIVSGVPLYEEAAEGILANALGAAR